MKIFDNTFAQAQTMLSLRGQRMEILSRNIANADTPNFKAQDLDFRDVLKMLARQLQLKQHIKTIYPIALIKDLLRWFIRCHSTHR